MKNRISLLLALSLIGCQDQPAKKTDETAMTAGRKYIGQTHGAELPAGVERKGWMYLDSLNGKDYGVTVVASGPARLFWLDESADVQGAKAWKVINVLGADSLPKARALTIGSCNGLGLQTTRIIALTERADPKAPATVLRAWKVDLAKRGFEEIRHSAIVCR
ncbi:MAG TPA: hypothetical protein VM100_01785 [Longimicrobiales bacterium]|nr:hypothetical protein [Longimicrobiales bacterium]